MKCSVWEEKLEGSNVFLAPLLSWGTDLMSWSGLRSQPASVARTDQGLATLMNTCSFYFSRTLLAGFTWQGPCTFIKYSLDVAQTVTHNQINTSPVKRSGVRGCSIIGQKRVKCLGVRWIPVHFCQVKRGWPWRLPSFFWAGKDLWCPSARLRT